ncbi:MAG: hemerythrin domain-containing protein [Promethearchaeota archaeon]
MPNDLMKEEKSIFKFAENPRENSNTRKISNYFLQDHKDISKILEDLEDISGNPEQKEEIVKKIGWKFEKHFYLEEKVFLFPEEVNQYVKPKLAKSLMKQHDNLLKVFKKIEKCKDFATCPEFQKLKTMIRAHIVFETKEVYPLISANLDEEQQAIVQESLSKAASMGFYPLESLRKYYQKQKKSKVRPKNIGKIM